jgi:hypothetical protein
VEGERVDTIIEKRQEKQDKRKARKEAGRVELRQAVTTEKRAQKKQKVDAKGGKEPSKPSKKGGEKKAVSFA